MYIFTCEHKWEAMLTCIYDAWASKKGHANIKLMLEPVEQYSLFDTYTHVDADAKKAESVMRSVKNKISLRLYRQLAYASMAYEKEILDLMQSYAGDAVNTFQSVDQECANMINNSF